MQSSSSRRRARRRREHSQAGIQRDRRIMALEPLEARHLLTVIPSLAGSVLTINDDGVGGADSRIVLTARESVNGTGTLMAVLNGEQEIAPAASLSAIMVYANGGDDFIDLRGVNLNDFSALSPTHGPQNNSHLDIDGGPGNDFILTGDTIDYATGSSGDDTIWAGPGDDILWGGDGADALWGEAGNDVIAGGSGDDHLGGGDGDDTLRGQDDEDTIDAGPGTNQVAESRGDDTVTGQNVQIIEPLSYPGSPLSQRTGKVNPCGNTPSVLGNAGCSCTCGISVSDTNGEAYASYHLSEFFSLLFSPLSNLDFGWGKGWTLTAQEWLGFNTDGDPERLVNASYSVDLTDEGSVEVEPGVDQQQWKISGESQRTHVTKDSGQSEYQIQGTSGARSTFDADGFLTEIQDPLGVIRRYHYESHASGIPRISSVDVWLPDVAGTPVLFESTSFSNPGGNGLPTLVTVQRHDSEGSHDLAQFTLGHDANNVVHAITPVELFQNTAGEGYSGYADPLSLTFSPAGRITAANVGGMEYSIEYLSTQTGDDRAKVTVSHNGSFDSIRYVIPNEDRLDGFGNAIPKWFEDSTTNVNFVDGGSFVQSTSETRSHNGDALTVMHHFNTRHQLTSVTYDVAIQGVPQPQTSETWEYTSFDFFGVVTDYVSRYVDRDGRQTLTDYQLDPASGLLVETTTQVIGAIDSQNPAAPDLVSRSWLNERGQIVKTESPNRIEYDAAAGPVPANVVEYEYDSDSQSLAKITYLDPTPGATQHPSVTFADFDEYGRAGLHADEVGRTTSIEYQYPGTSSQDLRVFLDHGIDVHNIADGYRQIVVAPDGDSGFDSLPSHDQFTPITIYEYDARGRLSQTVFTSVEDFDNGRIIRHSYDAPDPYRLTGTTTSAATWNAAQFIPLGPQVANSYDFDRVTRELITTDALARDTNTIIDGRGRIAAVVQPDPDAAAPAESPIRRMAYDANGRLIWEVDPLGAPTNHQYDVEGRLVTTISPNGARSTLTYTLAGLLQTETNAIGATTEYFYDDAGRQTRIHLPDPISGEAGDGDPSDEVPLNKIEYSYLPDGQVQSMTDPNGNTTEYTYDFRNRLATVELPDPDPADEYDVRPMTTYAYHADGQLASITTLLDIVDGNEVDAVTSYEYDGLGRLSQFMEPADQGGLRPTTAYAYNEFGQTRFTVDPLGQVTEQQYDGLGRLQHVIGEHPTDPGTGNPQQRPLTTYHYDLAGQVIMVDGRVSDTDSRSTTYQYDALGRLITEFAPNVADGSGAATFDAAGHVTYVSAFASDPSDGSIHTPITTYAYDAVGNLVSTTNRLGETQRYAYAPSADGYVMVQAIDANDGDGSVAGATKQGITTYEYDALGRMTALIDPPTDAHPTGNRTSWDYDYLDRVERETNVLDDSRVYDYDLIGNLVATTDRNGRRTTYQYDALHRWIAEHWHDATGNVQESILFAYDLGGRLASAAAADDGFSYAYDYDQLSRPIQSTIVLGDLTPQINQINAYNLNGLPAQTETWVPQALGGGDPLLMTTDYAYDGLNRINTITTQGKANTARTYNIAITSDFDFDFAGQLQTLTRLEAATPLAQTHLSYDGAGRIAAIDHISGTAAAPLRWWENANYVPAAEHLNGYHTQFDAAGRLTEQSIANLEYRHESVLYGYDKSGQLASSNFASLLANDDWNESYHYDASGNRLASDSAGNDSAIFATGENNLLLSDGVHRYGYDAEGNRTVKLNPTTGAVELFDWDHRNRLTHVTSVYLPSLDLLDLTHVTAYELRDTIVSAIDGDPTATTTKIVTLGYDHLNQQISRTVDSAADFHGDVTADGIIDSRRYFVYRNGQIELQFDGRSANDLSHFYVWGPRVDQLLTDIQIGRGGDNGHAIWPLTDHLGSVRDLIELQGTNTALVKHRVYDAFGNVLSESNQGDYNDDGYVTQSDVDILATHLGAAVDGTNRQFDFNGDGVIDATDQSLVLAETIGDLDDNGIVDSDDLGLLLNRFGEPVDFPWGEGVIDSHELGLLLNAFGDTHAVVDHIFGYTGRKYDEEIRLQNNLNRWYDSEVGRWLSEDPIGFGGGDANLYRYVGNRVTSRIDPVGLYDWEWGDFFNEFFFPRHGNSYVDYLTHPSKMDDGLETMFYVSGGIGLGAGTLATGGLLATSYVGGSASVGGFTLVSGGTFTTGGSAMVGAGIGGAAGGISAGIAGENPISGGVIGFTAGGLGGGAGSAFSTTGTSAVFFGGGVGGAVEGGTTAHLNGDNVAQGAAISGTIGFLTAGIFDSAGRLWAKARPCAGSSDPISTPVDLYAFGNRSAPRPPRLDTDLLLTDPSALIPPQSPPLPRGASTFADPMQAPLTGQFHRLPEGTPLPDGLHDIADGVDVLPISPHDPTHHTIFPTQEMSGTEFIEKFLSLPWHHAGKKK